MFNIARCIREWRAERQERIARQAWEIEVTKAMEDAQQLSSTAREFRERKKAMFSVEECIADMSATNRKCLTELQAIHTKNIQLTERVYKLLGLRDAVLKGNMEEALELAKECSQEAP